MNKAALFWDRCSGLGGHHRPSPPGCPLALHHITTTGNRDRHHHHDRSRCRYSLLSRIPHGHTAKVIPLSAPSLVTAASAAVHRRPPVLSFLSSVPLFRHPVLYRVLRPSLMSSDPLSCPPTLSRPCSLSSLQASLRGPSSILWAPSSAASSAGNSLRPQTSAFRAATFPLRPCFAPQTTLRFVFSPLLAPAWR